MSIMRERHYIGDGGAYQPYSQPDKDLLGGEGPYNPPDLIPIKFAVINIVKRGWIDAEDDEEPLEFTLEYEGDQIWVEKEEVIRDISLSRLKQSSSRSALKERFTHVLSTKLCVPEYKHKAIIEKIFAKADRDIFGLLPLLTLVVYVDYVTVRLLRRSSSPPPPLFPLNILEFEVASMLLNHGYQLACSTSLSNKINNHEDEELGLEKVRPDSLEAKKQQSCAICIQDFEEDNDAAPITRLPCFHLFHRHCIRPWLHKSLSCPMCRYTLRKKRKLDQILYPSSAPSLMH